MSFRGKTAIVTGASSGLGAALALELADRGADLALFSFERDKQEEVAELCRKQGVRAIAVIGDVTKLDDCRRCVDQARSELGRVDYLIANAGISMWARFDDIEDPSVFQRLIDVNYMGAVNCVHASLDELKKAKGMIVAITSIQARIPVPLHTGYVASKHALQGFCDSLRLELEADGVGVLTVLPHWLRGTELRKHALSGDGKELGEQARKHSSESISVDDASRWILDAMAARKRELVMPWKLKVLAALNAVFPTLAESIIRKAMKKQDASR